MKLFLAPILVGTYASIASAGLTTVAEFLIQDHPNGGLVDPTYALRLDGAYGLNEVTFSANVYNNLNMVISEDDMTGQIFIDIAGTLHGGEDTGAGWDSPFDIEVDFRYEANVVTTADGWAVDGFSALNNGTITRLDTMETVTWYALEDASGANGPAGRTFTFGADGWRLDGDDSSWVGRGWLTTNSDGSPISHGSQDWIFTAIKVPAPSGLALLAMGALGAARRRR
ncbi:MAG: PEP-CTERM sorting domain-containing protein [Phycisphaerales bacterium JB059]